MLFKMIQPFLFLSFALLNLLSSTSSIGLYIGPKIISTEDNEFYEHYYISHLLFVKKNFFNSIWLEKKVLIGEYIKNLEFLIKKPMKRDFYDFKYFINIMKEHYVIVDKSTLSLLNILLNSNVNDFESSLKVICMTIFIYLYNDLSRLKSEKEILGFLNKTNCNFRIFLNKFFYGEKYSVAIQNHFPAKNYDRSHGVFYYNKQFASLDVYQKNFKKVVKFIHLRYFKYLFNKTQKKLMINKLYGFNDKLWIFDLEYEIANQQPIKKFVKETKFSLTNLKSISVSLYDFYSILSLFKIIDYNYISTRSFKVEFKYNIIEIFINLNNYIPLLLLFNSLLCELQFSGSELDFSSFLIMVSYFNNVFFHDIFYQDLKNLLKKADGKQQIKENINHNKKKFIPPMDITLCVDSNLSTESIHKNFLMFTNNFSSDFMDLYETFAELARIYHKISTQKFRDTLISANNPFLKFKNIVHFCYFTKEKIFCQEPCNITNTWSSTSIENTLKIQFLECIFEILIYFKKKICPNDLISIDEQKELQKIVFENKENTQMTV